MRQAIEDLSLDENVVPVGFAAFGDFMHEVDNVFL